MLTLREDWRSVTGGAVAISLVAQVQHKVLRNETASQLVGASLDLFTATQQRKGRPPLRVERVSQVTWRISSLYYMYLPVDNDSATATCIRLARSSVLTVILPRSHEPLKRRLLMAALRGRAPPLWSFESFISWRTLCATIDQGWPRERAVLELLAAYNERALSAGRGDALLVDLPAGFQPDH